MSQRLRSTIIVTAVVSVLGCSQDSIVAPTDARPLAAVAQLVTPSSIGWQQQARVLIAGANMSPLAASRVLAALSVAQYRAVLEIESADTDGLLPNHGVGAGGRSAIEGQRGTVAAASARVLKQFFPAAASALDQRVAAEGSAGPGKVHPDFVRGAAIGLAVGEAMAAHVVADRFTAPWTGTVPQGADKWIANGPPAGATLGGMVPWFMTSGDQFRPPAPPAFGSAAFNADLAEIATLALNRTGAQTAMALFWNFTTGTYTPVGYWNEIAANFIVSARMNEQAATHVFALTQAAMMDAMIGCWDAKYFYWVMRPSQANPAITMTYGLPNHPSYPSGHSCGSGAASTVLSHFFPERATLLEAMVLDAGLSRMYGGIHYRFDVLAGQALGNAVAHWALSHQEAIQ